MNYEGIVYRPPSEARSFILQVTIGCAHNQCTFCTMYKAKAFRIRTLEEIRKDIHETAAAYGDSFRRIFLADGDALILPAETLLEILKELKQHFPSAERITSYGTPADVLRKTPDELKQLRSAGLSMVYMGAESGDDTILSRIHKGASSDEILAAGLRLRQSGIAVSVTLISGLGGRSRIEEHAAASARLISGIRPEYVGFLTLMLDSSAPIYQDISSGRLELLKPEELVDEMELFLCHVDAPGTVFRSNHASNYMMLKGTLNDDIPAMLARLADIRAHKGYRKESWRAL
jgi:radical SAM superfamily enzyme YgiQ (UPF0313 family)